jgi:hypothetical protein
MKRALLGLVVLGVAAVLAGCPIYSNQSDYRVCTGQSCYDCPDPSYSSMCVLWSCNTDSDCGDGYTCAGNGTCTSSSGDDASAPSDCSVNGCPAGEVCKLVGGVASCVLFGTTAGEDAGDATASQADASADAVMGSSDASTEATASLDGATKDASYPDGGDTGVTSPDGSDGSSESSTLPEASATIACNANGDCSIGASCVDGQCTPSVQLCSDGSQCAVSGDSCVNGLCTPACSASAPCPTGYACDFGLGLCDVNPSPCAGSGTSSCLGGSVCVESHCVPPCSAVDGGAACPGGQVCVNGGCIPDQKALFACRVNGASGVLANICDPSSVCLHHDCYTECDGDGGGCPASQCKQVTVGADTYAVCATATTLGSDCDLAAGASCPSSGVCVDGYCK